MKRPLKIIAPNSAHEALYQDLCLTLKKHSHLPKIELLAIGANLLGKLIAMQDQTKFTRDMVMEVVTQNIEKGNAEAFATLDNVQGHG